MEKVLDEPPLPEWGLGRGCNSLPRNQRLARKFLVKYVLATLRNAVFSALERNRHRFPKLEIYGK